MLYKQHPHRGTQEGEKEEERERMDGVREEEGVKGDLRCTNIKKKVQTKRMNTKEDYITFVGL